jgi:spermidine/putrescine transport system permease protein
VTVDVAASTSGRRALGGFFVLLAIFLYVPIAILMVFSFNDDRVIAFPLRGFTLQWYEEMLRNEQLIASLRVSAIVAAVSSAIAVVLGVLAGYALARRRIVARSAVVGLVLSPLVIPYLVLGIALLILFRALDQVLTEALGVYVGLGTHAIVIGHVVLALPYVILTIVPRLQRIHVAVEEAARDLGAGPIQTFRRVTVPLLMPAIVSAYLISFTLSFDEYALASFVAGEETTYPIFLYGQVRIGVGLPQMIAISALIMTVSLLVIVGAEGFRRRAERALGDVSPPALG